MGRSFTLRALLAGALIGVLINLSNTYYGLRVGVASQMSTVSGLLGFAGFKVFSRWTSYPLSAEENVLIISVATATGAMPVTAGFIGIIPALEYLIGPKENGPLTLSWHDLILWSIGLCIFGLIFASWLRPYFVDREDLPWPGARVTAQLVKSLHRLPPDDMVRPSDTASTPVLEEEESDHEHQNSSRMEDHPLLGSSPSIEGETEVQSLLKGGFAAGALTILMSFLPVLHSLPLFGFDAAKNWLWSIDLAPGFIGQGIITGPVIPLHMLAGTIVGWGILSPYAKNKGYAPGDVDDWENGPRGWIIWVSLSALLADAFVKLSWLLISPLWYAWLEKFRSSQSSVSNLEPVLHPTSAYDTFDSTRQTTASLGSPPQSKSFVSTKLLSIGFLASIAVCLISMGWTFGSINPWYYTLLSILLSIPMAVVGIRSLAETDYNPESALVSQLVFAQLISPSNPNGIIINLIAAATAQAGANQAGDLSYDLKVGSLIGAHPEAQTLGQVIGSLIGAIISCGIYKFYAGRNPIPGPVFRIPSSFLVLSTARLLMGQGLPTGVAPFVVGTAIIFAALTVIKMRYANQWWDKFIPSGVAFAIGIYNTPSFTITRALGGLIYWAYTRKNGGRQGNIRLVASGLVLGESVASLITLTLLTT